MPAPISATDTAGNTASGTGASALLDTAADVGANLAITYNATNASVAGDINAAHASATSFTVAGLDADASATVTFSGILKSTNLAGTVVKTASTNGSSTADLSVFKDGTITAAISATDTAGNTASDTGASALLDTTADVGGDLQVTVPDASINNSEKTAVAYTVLGLDPDATATVKFSDGMNTVTGLGGFADLTSLTDGPITVSISTTDTAGNIAPGLGTSLTLDTTAPVISGAANQTDEATSAAGAVATFSASASDAVDGSDPVVFKDGATVVHSGDTFSLGSHTIGETATDAAGNIGTSSFTITVQDTTAPVISGAANQTDEATSAAGAVATFSASASDAVDGSDPVVFKDGATVVHSGDTFSLGSHTIGETATDAAGNIGTSSFTITVQDTT